MISPEVGGTFSFKKNNKKSQINLKTGWILDRINLWPEK